jgi:hypothetical protein
MQSYDASAFPDGDSSAARVTRADFDAWEASLKRRLIRRVVHAILRAGYDGVLAYGAMVVPQSLAYQSEDRAPTDEPDPKIFVEDVDDCVDGDYYTG